MQRLVKEDPENATWQRDLANTFCSLGEAKQARGDLNGAVDAYRHGQSLMERLIDQDPNNIIWQGSLMACLPHLSIVLSRQGDQEGALATWYYFRQVAERLHSRKLDNVQMQEAIKEALSSADSGIKATLASDPARRLILLREQQTEDRRLSERDPGNSEITARLALTRYPICARPAIF